MDNEKRTGIQISQKQDTHEISIVSGGIKILASEKPIATSFEVKWGVVYILLDCSGSMKKAQKLDHSKLGIIDFAKDAFKKYYRVGIITFSSKAEMICEPTIDIDVLQAKIKEIRADGSTNMTAALKLAHSKLTDFTGTKVIVVATDGMPDHVKISLDFADIIKAAGIDIITIGTDDADQDFLKKMASRGELSSKVTSDLFARAITDASLLLMSPGVIPQKQD
jgi:Mg-chelatase subunit ChlD